MWRTRSHGLVVNMVFPAILKSREYQENFRNFIPATADRFAKGSSKMAANLADKCKGLYRPFLGPEMHNNKSKLITSECFILLEHQCACTDQIGQYFSGFSNLVFVVGDRKLVFKHWQRLWFAEIHSFKFTNMKQRETFSQQFKSVHNSEKYCAVLSISNMLHPHWHVISCEKNILADIICTNNTHYKIQSCSVGEYIASFDLKNSANCGKLHILHKKMCYLITDTKLSYGNKGEVRGSMSFLICLKYLSKVNERSPVFSFGGMIVKYNRQVDEMEVYPLVLEKHNEALHFHKHTWLHWTKSFSCRLCNVMMAGLCHLACHTKEGKDALPKSQTQIML